VTAPLEPARAVVAVGGNALTAVDQLGTWVEIESNAAETASSLASLVRAGWQVAVVHGNGPQVGNLAMQQDALAEIVPAQPLHQLCAMTQGQLGSVLVRAIDRECGPGVAACVVTHVGVDPQDPAFDPPDEADRSVLRPRAGRAAGPRARLAGRGGLGPRVPPRRRLAAAGADRGDGRRTHPAAGRPRGARGRRGGVAVGVGPDGTMTGTDAVIDKNLAAAALATAVGATELYLLTGVDCVLLDFGTPDQRPAHRLTPEEAAQHLADGQFPPGSMGPKITAALRFLGNGGRRVIITSVRMLAAAAEGRPGAGTCIEPAHVTVGSA
jgi:carbamate kinase